MAVNRVEDFTSEWAEIFSTQRRRSGLDPIWLAGSSGSGGGIGEPPGGFIGRLIQTRVAYDTSELATLATSSGSSLLDNLNHIRKRLANLEVGGGGSGSAIGFYDPGAVLFGDPNSSGSIAEDKNNFFWNASNKELVIGYPSIPGGLTGSRLHLVSDNAGKSMMRGYVYGNASSPILNMFHTSGSATAPAQTLMDYVLFRLAGSGYGATDYASSLAYYQAVAEENWNDSVRGTRQEWYNTPAGSLVPSLAMTLNGKGLHIGNTTAKSARLSVVGTSIPFSGNASGVDLGYTVQSTANNDTLIGLNVIPSLAPNGHTGVTSYLAKLTWAGDSGSTIAATAYGLYIDGPTPGVDANNAYGLIVNNANVGIGTASPPIKLTVDGTGTSMRVRDASNTRYRSDWGSSGGIITQNAFDDTGGVYITYRIRGNPVVFNDVAGTGGVGIGRTPSALLHIKAGTSGSNTSPLKFTAGTNLSTVEEGAWEYDGTHYYGSVGSTRYKIDRQNGAELHEFAQMI